LAAPSSSSTPTCKSCNHERAHPARQLFHQLQAKHQWFGSSPGFEIFEATLDFRVGGAELWRGKHASGMAFRNDTTYTHIVPGERIVYCYTMTINNVVMSTSLLTVELRPIGTGTELRLNEQIAVLDGSGAPCVSNREQGIGDMLRRLDEFTRGPA
jgi:uncharacterized protein YndB with AHSA1/START domain